MKSLLQNAAASAQPLAMNEVYYAGVKYMLLKKDGTEAWRRAAD